MHDGNDTHDKCDDGADNGGDGSAFDAELREAEIAADEQIVEDDIDKVGNNIGIHGNFGIAGSALCRVMVSETTLKNIDVYKRQG